MGNDSRNDRVKEMTDIIKQMYADSTNTDYDFDDEPDSNGLSESQINRPRTDRVATSMRSQNASRVQSVDMSSATRSSSATRTSGSRTTSTSRTSGSRSAASSAKRPVSSATKAAQSRNIQRSSSAAKAQEAKIREAKVQEELEHTASMEPIRAYSDVLEEKKRSKRTSASPTTKHETTASAARRTAASSARRTAASSSRSSGSRPSTRKNKGLSGFKKFVIIYSAILLVLIIVTAIVLNSFLKNYEKNQPSNVAAYVVQQFETPEKLRSFLDDNASITNQSTAILNYEDAFIDSVSGKKISYIEDPANTTSEVTSYRITADSIPVASIVLGKGAKGAFGLSSWVLTAIDTTSAFTDVKTYSILVPEGSTVVVNDTELSPSLISGTGIPEVLETSREFISDPPTYSTYNVKVVSDSISVSGTDPQGAALVFSQTENSFVAGGKASDEFIESVEDRVEAALREYALYFIYEAFDLESYIVDGCELYAFIFGGEFAGESYDPINPWLYNFEYIDDYSFSTFEAKNYTKYSDDCFTVDISYKLDITFTDESYSDDNQKLDATWVWVRQGDQWYLSASKTH